MTTAAAFLQGQSARVPSRKRKEFSDGSSWSGRVAQRVDPRQGDESVHHAIESTTNEIEAWKTSLWREAEARIAADSDTQ